MGAFMGRTLSQYAVTLSCVLGIVVAASSTVWYNPIQEEVLSEGSPIKLSKKEYSAIIAARQIGAIIGALPVGAMSNRWGRKTVLLSSFPCSALGWLLTGLGTSIPVLLLARMMLGLAGGIVVVLSPVYIAEISEPRLRGSLCPFISVAWSLGMLWDFILGPVLSYYVYMAAAIFPALLFFATFSSMPESPYYLMMVNKDEEAERALSWLRGGEPVKQELEEIKRTVEKDMQGRRGAWRDLVSPQCRKQFLIANTIVTVKFLTGMKALEIYSTGTLSCLGISAPREGTALLGVVQLSSALVASWVSGVCARRPLLLSSLLVLGSADLTLGLCSLLDQQALPHSAQALILVCLLIGVASFRLGVSAYSDLITESFPTHVRPTLSAFVITLGNVYTLVSVILYRYFEDTFGPFYNYFIFSFVSFAGFLSLSTTMQETAFRSLGEIQEEIRVKRNRMNF